jgi:type III pantothenate kinase
MILCLDAGNSRLKWGLRDSAGWHAQGALDHLQIGELAGALPARPCRIVACNVAGEKVAAQIEALAVGLAVPLDWLRSSASAGGVVNGYDNPAQLGADRWAALIGARGLHSGAALVVMAGTATTVDFLDAQGVFRGGLILPGLDLMRLALARNTAGLPEACGVYRELPTNTDDAIVSGCIAATVGAVERMAKQACRPHVGCECAEGGLRRPATADFLCLLSGGAADVLAPHLELPLRRINNLVLEGLVRLATS